MDVGYIRYWRTRLFHCLSPGRRGGHPILAACDTTFDLGLG